VIVVHEGVAVATGAPADPLPLVTSTTTAVTVATGPGTTVAALPEPGDAAGAGFPLGLVAVMGAAMIAAGLLATRVRRR
jgi:hypothetical protein